MTQTCNDSITISVLSHLLNPIHNKLLIKSSVNSLPDGRKWWLQCYPAGNAENRKDALILILRLTGGPASVSTRVSIKETIFSCDKKFDIKKDNDHSVILLLKHDARLLNSSKNIEIEVHGTFDFGKVNSQVALPTSSGQFVLTEAEVNAAKIGDCLSTPKYDVPSIPGLQWWLDYYPCGNDDTESKTLMVAMRVSMVPMNVTLKFSIKNATKTVFSGSKMFLFTNVAELRYIVQMKHENSNFKDCFVNRAITFACLPTFTVPTGEVVSPPPVLSSFDAQSVAGSTSSLVSQQTSRSSSIQSVAEPRQKSIPVKVADSCTVYMTKADLHASNTNKVKTTSKRSFSDVPGLQWWLEYYPAGNSVNDRKRVIILIRASCAPITITATYYIPGTVTRRDLTSTLPLVSSRGCNYVIPHEKLAFDSTQCSQFCCDVTITVPEKLIQQLKLTSIVPKPVPSSALPAKPSTVNSPTTVTDSTYIVFDEKVDLHRSKAGKSRITQKRRINQIPNLEWWIEVFPAGNSPMDLVVCRAFIHVSVVPVDITAIYSYAGTEIKRQIPFKFVSTAARGANFSVSHQTLIAAKAFANGKATLHCTVIFNLPQVQFPLPKAAKTTAVTQENPTPIAVISPLSSQPIEQPSRTTHTLKFYAKREHFTNPNYIITSSKRKIQDDIEWFITSTPGGKDIDGNGCLTVYLNASTNVSGNVKYEVEGTHLRGSMAFRESTLIQIKQILHTDLDAYPLIKQFDIKIVATLGSSSRSTTPTTSSGSAELDSSEGESDDEEDGMTDGELLLHRLKIQEDETNKVLELLKRGSPVLIADGADFL
uniref:SHR-BD domain-containing protein n=1 Tax=Panagrellus redivivus TaxID=6233 RepID=A0A7E4V8Z6_PANRE